MGVRKAQEEEGDTLEESEQGGRACLMGRAEREGASRTLGF